MTAVQTIWPWQKGKRAKYAKRSVAHKKERGPSFEEVIGEKWMQIAGVIFVLLGVTFFLKYSFDQGWVSPAVQVGIGIVLGLLFVGGGEFFVKRYKEWAHVLTGAGIAILYFSFFAARNEFELLTEFQTFVALIPVTALAGLLAIRYNSFALSIFGMLGGYSAPLLIGTAEQNTFLVLVYTLILSVGVFGIAYFKRWPILELLAFLISFSYWDQSFGKLELKESLALLGGFFVVFSLLPCYGNLIKKKATDSWSLFLILFNGLFSYYYLYQLLEGNVRNLTIGICVLSALFFFETFLAYMRNRKDKALTYTLLGLGVASLTTVLPIQAEGFALTIGLLVETFLLFWIGFKLQLVWVRRFAMALGSLGFLSLVINISNLDFVTVFDGAKAIANEWTLALATATAVYAGIAWLYKKRQKQVNKELWAGSAALFSANITGIELISVQIDQVTHAYGFLYSVPYSVAQAVLLFVATIFLMWQFFKWARKSSKYLALFTFGSGLLYLSESAFDLFEAGVFPHNGFHLTVVLGFLAALVTVYLVKDFYCRFMKKEIEWIMGCRLVGAALILGLLNLEVHFFYELQALTGEIFSNIVQAKDATFSVVWALYSIFYLVLGIWRRVKTYRYIGLLGFGVTVVKVFFLDMENLSSIYRIIAFICLGVLLIIGSFLYQKYKKVIQERVL